jgi:hypothetical protein
MDGFTGAIASQSVRVGGVGKVGALLFIKEGFIIPLEF